MDPHQLDRASSPPLSQSHTQAPPDEMPRVRALPTGRFRRGEPQRRQRGGWSAVPGSFSEAGRAMEFRPDAAAEQDDSIYSHVVPPFAFEDTGLFKDNNMDRLDAHEHTPLTEGVDKVNKTPKTELPPLVPTVGTRLVRFTETAVESLDHAFRHTSWVDDDTETRNDRTSESSHAMDADDDDNDCSKSSLIPARIRLPKQSPVFGNSTGSAQCTPSTSLEPHRNFTFLPDSNFFRTSRIETSTVERGSSEDPFADVPEQRGESPLIVTAGFLGKRRSFNTAASPHRLALNTNVTHHGTRRGISPRSAASSLSIGQHGLHPPRRPGMGSKLTRAPVLTVSAQLEQWTDDGRRRLTLADDLDQIFAPEKEEVMLLNPDVQSESPYSRDFITGEFACVRDAKDHPTTFASHIIGQARNNRSQESTSEERLQRAARESLLVVEVIQHLDREISEMETLEDCSVFIPFMIIFIVSFLFSVNITSTFYVGASLQVEDLDSAWLYSDAVNRIMQRNVLRGEPVVDYSNGNTTIDSWPSQRYGLPFRWMTEQNVQLDHSFLSIKSVEDYFTFVLDAFVPLNYLCDGVARDYVPPYRRREGNQVLIGAARLRVQRVRPDSCAYSRRLESDANSLTPTESQSIPDLARFDSTSPAYEQFLDASLWNQTRNPRQCYATFSSAAAEVRPFCNAVNPATFNESLFNFRECSITVDQMPRSTYPCSGFIAQIPFNTSCSQISNLMKMIFPTAMSSSAPDNIALQEFRHFTNASVDFERAYGAPARYATSCDSIVSHPATRFVALEYFVLSLSTNTMHRVSFLAEVTAGGAWNTDYVARVFEIWNTTMILRTVFDFVIFVAVIFFAAKFVRDWQLFNIRTNRWLPFLFDIWNILEAANLVTFVVSVSLQWAWWLLSYTQSLQNSGSGVFPDNFETIEVVYTSQRYSNAVNLVLCFIKLLKYLKLNDRLGILTRTLYKNQGHLLAIFFIFGFFITGYAISAVMLYGSALYGFRTVGTSLNTLLLTLLGQFDYASMRAVQPTLTFMYLLSFFILGMFFLLNFIIVILSKGFSAEMVSMNMPPLSVSILRFLDYVRLMLRPVYVLETLSRRFYQRSRLSYMKEARDSLVTQHHQITTAFLQGTVTHAEPQMNFADLEWWIPPDVFEGLGRQYLLVTWEDAVYQTRWNRSAEVEQERVLLRDVIQRAVSWTIGGTKLDLELLDAYADRCDNAFEKLFSRIAFIETAIQECQSAEEKRERMKAEVDEARLRLEEAMREGGILARTRTKQIQPAPQQEVGEKGKPSPSKSSASDNSDQSDTDFKFRTVTAFGEEQETKPSSSATAFRAFMGSDEDGGSDDDEQY